MRIVQGVFWWFITIVILFVIDDLAVGPIFWLLSLINPILSTVMAFCSSFVVTLWLVYTGVNGEPGRFARFALRRLMLERSNQKIAEREASIGRYATSISGAIIATPLIGGVIPSLLLYKHRVLSRVEVKRLAVLLAFIYSAEFALIHGGYGMGAVLRLII